jgi:ADP-ribose pyrophosphatase YjhB (NUDIX family)
MARPRRKQPLVKNRQIRSECAKEVSVLAWIQDPCGNVLVVQQTTGKRLWSLPGGKVNGTEGLKRALYREVKEEIGLGVASAKVLDLFDRPERSGLAVLFRTILRQGKFKLGENEIEQAAFVSKLPRNSTPSARHFWRRQFQSLSARGNTLDL